MVPGMIRRDWSLAEQRRQELLDQAAQLAILAEARRIEPAPVRSVRLRAAIRAFGSALTYAVENAHLERTAFGPRGFFRDERS